MSKDLNRHFSKENKEPISTLKDVQNHQSSGKCKSKWEIPLHLLRQLKPKRQTITSIGKDVEKFKLLYTAGETVKWYSHFGQQFDSSSKD